MRCQGRNAATKGVDVITSLTVVMAGSIGIDRQSNRKLQCDKLEREKYWSTAVAVGDPEWLAAHVAAKKLRRHRIIQTDNAHYLQGTGNTAVKKLKLKIFCLEISF